MTLSVEFDHFVEAVQRYAPGALIYACKCEGKTKLTAANPVAQCVINTSISQSVEEAMKTLTERGLEVRAGRWVAGQTTDSDRGLEFPYVAAVSYKSGEEMPGVWVDAFSDPPSPATVLKALYEEFRQTGELGELAFEEFLRLANPNVVIASPADLEGYLSEKDSTGAPDQS